MQFPNGIAPFTVADIWQVGHLVEIRRRRRLQLWRPVWTGRVRIFLDISLPSSAELGWPMGQGGRRQTPSCSLQFASRGRRPPRLYRMTGL